MEQCSRRKVQAPNILGKWLVYANFAQVLWATLHGVSSELYVRETPLTPIYIALVVPHAHLSSLSQLTSAPPHSSFASAPPQLLGSPTCFSLVIRPLIHGSAMHLVLCIAPQSQNIQPIFHKKRQLLPLVRHDAASTPLFTQLSLPHFSCTIKLPFPILSLIKHPPSRSLTHCSTLNSFLRYQCNPPL